MYGGKTPAAPANVDKMEQALYISLLQLARRMLRVTTSLEPATQSKLLTCHFLLERVCFLVISSTCFHEIATRGEC